MTFNPSPQQLSIFDAISRADSNILVEACAGSGKTTTIVEGMKYVSSTAFVQPSKVFLAFNKQIAETLKSRCPNDVLCSTFHALGFRALKESGIVERNVKVDGGKCRWILYDLLDKNDDDFRNILKLVGLLKGSVNNGEAGEETLNQILEVHDLSFDNDKKAIALAQKVIEISDSRRDRIDFDDMLHLAVKFNARFEPRDWIFVDEAQDLNAIQHEIVARLQKSGGIDRYDDLPHPSPSRLVAVGDPHQAIYGFRGALSDSMSTLARRFSTQTYPLSVSFRCPKAVVREAQRYLKP